MTLRSLRSIIVLTCSALACALGAGAVWAEKADRSKPMFIEADRDAVIDSQRQLTVYTGNAVISQGSMVLRAERIELRQTPDGYRAASAVGSRAKPATWRQRRDGVDESVEGTAERIEFDGKSDTLRFVGSAAIRRSRAGTVADEITGATIVWDNLSEVFKVEGGSPTASNPTGRVRAVLSPRAEPSASAPAGAALPLAPSRALEERR